MSNDDAADVDPSLPLVIAGGNLSETQFHDLLQALRDSPDRPISMHFHVGSIHGGNTAIGGDVKIDQPQNVEVHGDLSRGQ